MLVETKWSDPSLYLEEITSLFKEDNYQFYITTKKPQCFQNIDLENYKNNILFETTITGFGSTVLEPNIPPFEETLSDLHSIGQIIGNDRLRFRISPILITDPFSKRNRIGKVKEIIKEISEQFPNPIINIEFLQLTNRIKEKFEKSNLYLKASEYYTIDRKRWHVHVFLAKRIIMEDFVKTFGETVEFRTCFNTSLKPCISNVEKKLLTVSTNSSRRGCRCNVSKKELFSREMLGFRQCSYNCLYCFMKH